MRAFLNYSTTIALISAAILVAVICGTAAAEEYRPSTAGNTYDGMTLAQWRERIKSLPLSGPQAVEAVPGLLAIVQDEQLPTISRRQAALTLGRIGKPANSAVPLLIRYCQSKQVSQDTLQWAAKSLALFGREAKAAAPVLVQRLQDESLPISLRQGMLEPLAQIGPNHPLVIPALMQTLTTRPSESITQTEAAVFRQLAAESLALIGPAAATATPLLIRAIQDEQEAVRRQAVTTLGRFRSQARIAIPALVDSLTLDPSEAVRDAAAVSLSQIGRDAVPVFRQLLTDREIGVRLRAIRGLGLLEGTAQAAVPDLLKLRESDNDDVRMTVLESLWQITQKQETLFPALLNPLQSSQRQIRKRAVTLLVTVQPLPTEVLQQLKALRSHENRAVRSAVRELERKLTAIPTPP